MKIYAICKSDLGLSIVECLESDSLIPHWRYCKAHSQWDAIHWYKRQETLMPVLAIT